MLTNVAVGNLDASYLKQLGPASVLFFQQDMEIWSNPFNGGRRSYDGRSTPQYGDTVSNPFGVGQVPGYDLQIQIQQYFEGNGHKLEVMLGGGGWTGADLILTLTAAGDSGSGVTMTSPWTTIPRNKSGIMTVWDTYPGFTGDAHFKLESIWYRYAPRI